MPNKKISIISSVIFLLSLICLIVLPFLYSQNGTLSYAQLLIPLSHRFESPEIPIIILGSFTVILSICGIVLSLRTPELNLITAIIGTIGIILIYWFRVVLIDFPQRCVGYDLTPIRASMIGMISAGFDVGYDYWLAMCFLSSAAFLNYYVYFKGSKTVSNSTVYCTKCGLKNSSTAKFCTGCGSTL